ncbi:MAG: cell division protein SepF [Oscillospiraceae bacterium]|jgi:cell division inhibitor SepF|nr:cell division protein SepF [Oscillospiraceae bacterium]
MAKSSSFFKNFFRPMDDDDDYDDDDYDGYTPPVPEQPPAGAAATAPKTERSTLPNSGAVRTFHVTAQVQYVIRKPKQFEEAAEIADQLKDGHAIVLNLEETDDKQARRVLDFIGGVAYSLKGQVKRIAVQVYMITPNNYTLIGDIADELESSGSLYM